MPMILTLASIIVTLSFFIPSTWKDVNKNSAFLRIDTRYVLQPDNLDKIPSDNKGYKKAGLEKTNAPNLGLKDFYNVNIMNYCEGSFSVEGDAERGVWKIDKCHGAKTKFTFKPVDLLEAAKDLSDKIPQKIVDAQKYMDSVWKIMVGAYIVGFIANILTFVIGWFGLLSRWGSFATTLFATVAMGGTLVGAILSTLLFNSLKVAFNKTKEDFGIQATVFVRPVYYTWAAWVFSLGAVIFWLASACCCSGRTKAVMGSGTEKNPAVTTTTATSGGAFGSIVGKVKGLGGSKGSGYAPLGGQNPPAYGQTGHNMDTFNNHTGYGQQTTGAYEPYAHR